MELFELIETLTSAHGPSGDEGEIRDTIARLARPYADEIYTDTLGDLIVHKKGDGPKVLFSAHMDSIGFIVTHIEEKGFLRVGRLGGVDPKEAVYTAVCFQNGTRGVFVPEEKGDKLTLEQCYIDIGAKSREAAREKVQVGDTAVYCTAAFQQGSHAVSRYLDDRIACAVLLSALEQLERTSNDLYFLFSVQEEVGLRGAKTAAWSIAPDYGIVVDVTDVDDTPGSERCGTAQLGGGAAIKVMDRSVICHPAIVSKLEELARARSITSQKDILRTGGTDGGPIHLTRTGVLTGGISIPCRYMHTPCEMVSLDDSKACIQLVKAFAEAELDLL